MHASKSIKFAVGVMGFLPLLVSGAEPSTQPASHAEAAPGGFTPVAAETDNPLGDGTADTTQRHPDGPGRGRFFRGMLPTISDSDRTQAMQYLAESEHSPNRYAYIQALPNGERKTALIDVAARNYVKWMQQMKDEPDLYSVTLQRIAVEDKIFGIVTKKPKGGQDADQSELRDQVTKLVDLGIQERQIRLKKLSQALDDQKTQLAADQNNRDALVEDRLKNIVNEGRRLFPNSDNNGGGGGGHNHAGKQ